MIKQSELVAEDEQKMAIMMQSELDKLHTTIANFEDDNDILNGELNEYQEEVERLQGQVDSNPPEEIGRLKRKNESLRNANLAYYNTIAELQNQVKGLCHQTDRQYATIRKQRSFIDKLTQDKE